MNVKVGARISTALGQLYHFMPAQRRREFVGVIVLMITGAIAELVAIGAVLPFLTLLADPGRVERLPSLVALFKLLGATSRDHQMLATTALFMIAAILAGALRLQLAWSSQNFICRVGHDMAVDIQRRILSQPYSFHISRNSSEIIASLEKVHILVFAVLLQLMQAAIAAFISVCIIIALISVDPFTALVSAGAFGLMYIGVSAFTRDRLSRNSAISGAAFGQRVRITQESLGGIRDVIIDGSQDIYLEAFREVDLQFVTAKANTAFVGAAPRFVIEAAGMVLIAALALVLSGREAGFAGALPVLGVLAIGAQRLLPMVQQVYYGWATLTGNRSMLEDVLAMMRLPVSLETQSARLPALPVTNGIVLEGISFAYPGRAQPALDRVSLTIPRGAKVALIGRTGSGKSTLADVLMGLLEPSAGQIMIDGVALGALNRRRWQKSIAHVPQAIFLADTTIARNIAFGVAPDQIDPARVVEAGTHAQLHDFILELPQGYDTSVGERGVRLSGGQRQRLGIARAIYKRAPVLVFDEATSALDDSTEAAVIEALESVAADGCTIVMIAHRLSTVANCDIVARLDNGRIIAIGSYADVIDANHLSHRQRPHA